MTMINEMDLAEIRRLIGKRFRHYKGGEYIVTQPVFDATEDRWMVGYIPQGAGCGALYTRTLADFTSAVAVARFAEITP